MTKLGAGMYRSEDGGATWTFINRYISRPFYYIHVAISPLNDKDMYHYNINFGRSTDGGKTFVATGRGWRWWRRWRRWRQPASTAPAGQRHALLARDVARPAQQEALLHRQRRRPELTHDDGANSLRFNNINVTQYYDVAADMREPYWVCGGLQDAGSSCGPSATRATAIYTSDWFNPCGGDGYHAAIDPRTGASSIPSRNRTSGGNVVRRTRDAAGQSIRPNKGVTSRTTTHTSRRRWRSGRRTELGRGAASASARQRGGGGRRRWRWRRRRRRTRRDDGRVPLQLDHAAHPVAEQSADAVHRRRTTSSEHATAATTGGSSSPDLTKNDPERTMRKSGGLTPDENPGGGAEFHGTIITVVESPVSRGESGSAPTTATCR